MLESIPMEASNQLSKGRREIFLTFNDCFADLKMHSCPKNIDKKSTNFRLEAGYFLTQLCPMISYEN